MYWAKVYAMAQTLLSLLRDSRTAAQSGASAATSWRLASDFARQYWLATPDEVPDELVGEFYSMRASAADHLGFADEAIAALRDLRAWARSNVAARPRSQVPQGGDGLVGKTQVIRGAGPHAVELAHQLVRDLVGGGQPVLPGEVAGQAPTRRRGSPRLGGGAAVPEQ